MKYIRYIFICSLTIILESCTIYSFTGSSISPDVKTVSIQYFPNKALTINPTLSQDFTEELKDYFIKQTNLKLIENGGDLSFNGEITDYNIKPIAIQANETAGKNRLSINVKVAFTNHYEQSNNFEKVFNRYRDYESSLNLSDTNDEGDGTIEDDLVEDIIDELIEDIFNNAVANW